ncbi:hypothetical protein [Cellulomonas sp. P5_C5]
MTNYYDDKPWPVEPSTAPPDIVRPERDRPDKATVRAMLAMNEHDVALVDHLATEDVDGDLLGMVELATEGRIVTDLAGLGWTVAEFEDDSITK